ncbi:primase/helicase protein [Pseudomonas phage vB_PaeP_FBPa25]|uniref:Primase/helicase protein n=6 Tax=Viruses TaxID=10239 RepID=A0A9E7QL57_9CAUD|nr:DNA primase [Pseudomonas phage MPK6]QQL99138.1 primase/helicase protein [Pseudomonas phage MYY9]QQL99190.1 primase/helicase protein [Pseudomonas phage HX1]UVN13048.1 primase/helicase protein [Pseudomonas phage vB_PaeM_FBPa3]UVN13170.1 primase/helicase protein [Pseudomonas phage vB_PaeP_FBPa6]UVN13549.1 primase/helicase protein [Pseudomonas phage vB_PaeP_FBPa18]UVN13716.1 primase/helicase protein [Pseudomonas phage vB_PaeP_FBPa25]WOZ53306.1 primase/helicase protein [Pseudomonas phage PA69]
MALRRDSWLKQAQSLAVGQVGRFRHVLGCKSMSRGGTNMTCKNLPDRWVAYCYSCQEGGVVEKTHVRRVQCADQERFMPWPEDASDWTQADCYQSLYGLLLSKGIDYNVMTPGLPLLYSGRQHRLIFPTDAGWIGRATADQNPKWVGYGYPAPDYHGWPQELSMGRPWVLTEDYLSALKVRWACPEVFAVGLNGTRLRDRLAAIMLQQTCKRAFIFLDGDPAGVRGSAGVMRRLRSLLIEGQVIPTPDGFDPKDLTREQIRSLVIGRIDASRTE